MDGQTLFQEFTPLEKDLRVTRDGLLRLLHEERRAHRANWMDCSESNRSRVVKRNPDLIFPKELTPNVPRFQIFHNFIRSKKNEKLNELESFFETGRTVLKFPII